MSSGSMSRRRSLLGLLGGAAAIPFAAPSRSAPASNCGLVVLTVGGLVGSPNRPPFDEKRDRFFQHNNLDFKQARVFTFGDLLAFPQQSAPVVEESGEILFKGPRLHDVLAAAKPLSDAKTARLSALDGYGGESLSPRSIRKVGFWLSKRAAIRSGLAILARSTRCVHWQRAKKGPKKKTSNGSFPSTTSS